MPYLYVFYDSLLGSNDTTKLFGVGVCVLVCGIDMKTGELVLHVGHSGDCVMEGRFGRH